MIDLHVSENRAVRFEIAGDVVHVYDVRFERITPNHPQKHLVVSPLFSISKDETRVLNDYLTIKIG